MNYVSTGHKRFRGKQFSEAVKYYLEAAKRYPFMADSLKVNIRLAIRYGGFSFLDEEFDKAPLSQLADDLRCAVGLPKLPEEALIRPDNLEQYYFDKIVESGLFDPSYYRKQCADELAQSQNPLAHYLDVGMSKGYDPSPEFNTNFYKKQNPDVVEAGINPFIHYVCNGQAEGRDAVPQPYKSRYEVAPVEYIPRVPEGTPPPPMLVKPICFYLPQFHAIPENDEWWGKGFTEWTNVKPAQPQFEGHYQPHVPHEDIGYYNLLDREAQAKQIELAKQYGIGGFCYYLYWFSGKRLLEQPLDNMLADPTLDFPFCVCWANENWSRRWDGLDHDLLMVQDYSDEDDIAFITNISKYLRDDRYIRIDGKPLLVIYRPNLFPDMKSTVERWRRWCRDNGIGEIYLAYPQSFEAVDPAVYDFDAALEFPPNNSKPPNITKDVTPLVDDFQAKVYDWRIFVERSDDYKDPGYTLFRSATPAWDNTARKKSKGTVFHNSCPKLFTKYLKNAFSETLSQRDNPDERLVFINAWNEWAEGAHLEPDERYGYAWLQSVKDAQEAVASERKRIVVVCHDAHPHGAQLLCLNFAKEFSSKFHFDVEMIVLGEGQLIPKFQQFATVHQVNIDFEPEEKVAELLESLKVKGASVAIVNTTVSGKIVPYLKRAHFSVVSLIHELPSVLNGFGLQDHARLIAEHADKVVFPAHQVQEGFETFVGRPLDQAIIRPQGIYLPSLLRQGASKEEISKQVRFELGIPEDAIIIMCAGYADHRKGFDYFVKSCSDLIEQRQNVYALWVGHMDTAFVDECMEYAKQRGTETRFLFTGLVDDPRKYYAAASIYALTSREDPFPSVVMEALDALTPVVAFRDSGGFENLLSRGCGLLVEKDSGAGYTEALLDLVDHPLKAKNLAVKGQEIVLEEFSFYHYLYDLLEFGGSPVPKVSVVVPNYNYQDYIGNRLSTIFDQTFPIYELIVLDDRSADNSVQIIEEYLRECKLPHKLVVNEENSGSVFKQWRKGAELARGDYLWIAEADDLAEPKFLESLIRFFDDRKVVLAYSQSKQIDQDGRVLALDYLDYTSDLGDYWRNDYAIEGEEEVRRALCVKNTIPNVSAVLFEVNSFRESIASVWEKALSLKVAGDWLIYLKVAEGGRFAYCSASLNQHRRHSSSVTKANNHLSEVVAVQDWAVTRFALSGEMVSSIKKYREKLERYFSC